MTIEQKAKAYDKAIKRAIKHRNNDGLTLEQYDTIDIIFPELKESKDEKIRMSLIELFKDMEWDDSILHDYNMDKDKTITWLEKQSEPHIACSEEQMKVLEEVLNFAANHESPYWNNYIFETLNNLIRQLKN